MKKYILLLLIGLCSAQMNTVSAQNGCGSAIPLTPGVQQCGNSAGIPGGFDGASGVPTNPCNSFYNDDEYWFSYTSNGVDALSLTLSGITNTYAGLFVFDACAASAPTCISSATNGSVTTDLLVTPGVLPAGTYYIVIASWGLPDNTSFCLDATAGPAPVLPTSCPDMEPICTNNGLTFTAQTGVGNAEDAEPGNNYGCLSFAEFGTSPNPTWYYLEISTSGDLNMELSALNDIDFALWGPFTDLTNALASCGSYPYPIDCSYLSNATEYPDITGAVAGEVYVLMITNFNNTVQDVSLQQIGGTAATNCGIVCGSSAGTITTVVNNPASANYVLCDGEGMSFTSNDDYILPPAADVSGLGYAIYTADPTTGDPSTDPNWTGYYWTGEDLPEVNDVNNLYDFVLAFPSGGAGANGVPFGNQLVFVPITMDDIASIAAGGADDNLGHDIDGDGCFSLGTPSTVTYLDPILGNSVENCGTDIVFTLSGGWPGFNPAGSFTVTNTGAGTMTQSGTQGETLTFTGFTSGQTVSVSVTDDSNGCTYIYSAVSACTAAGCAADAGNW